MKNILSIGSIAVSSMAIAISLSPIDRAQAANLVLNGGFIPVAGTPFAKKIENDTTTIPNWTSLGYNFLYKDGLNATGNTTTLKLYSSGQTVNSADGSEWFIAADGAFKQKPISQTLSGLIVGNRYDVTFYQAAGQQTGYEGDTTDLWAVNLGGTFNNASYYAPYANAFTGGTTLYSALMSNLSKAPVSGWTKQTLTFTATSTNPVLNFLAEGTPVGQPPFALLSGVSVTAAVPEPLTIVGTLVGLGFGAGLRSKLTKKKLEQQG
jgi:hypothetical protein